MVTSCLMLIILFFCLQILDFWHEDYPGIPVWYRMRMVFWHTVFIFVAVLAIIQANEGFRTP